MFSTFTKSPEKMHTLPLSTPEKQSSSDCDSNDSLLEHEEFHDIEFAKSSPSSWHDIDIKAQMFNLAGAIMMIVGIVTLISGLMLHANIDTKCFQRVSNYSPMIKSIDTSYHDVRFNGSLDYPSIYRGRPSPAVDEAWNKYEEVLDMTITEEELVKAGMPKGSVRVADELGGGYLASIEVTHQMHCLNFLRKALFFNYDYYHDMDEFTDAPATVITHLGHCMEMIRQNLVCSADVGIISYKWVKDYPRPYPNFNTVHKCRNFDSIMDVAMSSQLARPEGYKFAPLPGDTIWDEAP